MSRRQTIEYYCDICDKVYPEDMLHEVTIPTAAQAEDDPVQYTDGHTCHACAVKLSRYIKQLRQGTYEQKTDHESTAQQQPPMYEPESLLQRIFDSLHYVLKYNQEQYPERGLHYACCNEEGRVRLQDTYNLETAGVWAADQHVPPGLSLVVTDRPDLDTWLKDNANSIPEAFKYAAVDINGVACACINPPVFAADKCSWDYYPDLDDTYSIPGVWDARYPGAIYSLVHYRKGVPK